MVKEENLKDITFFSSLGLSYYRLKKYVNAVPLFEMRNIKNLVQKYLRRY